MALGALVSLLALNACQAGQNSAPVFSAVATTDVKPVSVRPEESRMWMTVGDRRFAITLADNAAARAFAAQFP